MENKLQVFTNEEINANVRVVEIDGQPYFVAKDVCDCLELTNPTVAIDRRKSEVKKFKRWITHEKHMQYKKAA